MSKITILSDTGDDTTLEIDVVDEKHVTLDFRSKIPLHIKSTDDIIDTIRLPGIGHLWRGAPLKDLLACGDFPELPSGDIANIVFAGNNTFHLILE